MPTYTPKASEIHREWHVVDADGLVLGRLCTEVARVLRGKHKPTFAPHIDTGDHVIIINADKIVMTAGKAERTMVYRHSGYPGGIKSESYANLHARKPEEALRKSIRGMLPKGPLGRQQLLKLQGVRRPDTPARRPDPRRARDPGRQGPLNDRLHQRDTHMGTNRSPRPPAAARKPSPGPSSAPAPVSSRSTAKRSMSTSRPPCRDDRLRGAPRHRHRRELRRRRHRSTVVASAVRPVRCAWRSPVRSSRLDPESRAALKKAGLLTRDSRKKESKKYGLKKARKAPQYTKR